MSKDIRIRRGLDIPLEGQADRVLAPVAASETYVVKPTDFHGLTPKLTVREGDEVKAGSILFYDKYNEKVKFTSPVSGEVVEIIRGAKRKVLGVKILADKEINYETFEVGNASSMNRDQIIDMMCQSGLWPLLKRRPYNVIANPEDQPRDIFISSFDSAPLAQDNDFLVHGQEEDFQAGLDILGKLTEGKVHLTLDGNTNSSSVFSNAKGVEIHKIQGPHPAGNVGVQIHHIAPINKGEVIWTIRPQDILILGRFFKTGKFDLSKIIAIAGSEIEKPRYSKVIPGAQISTILADNLKSEKARIISGNVLTGEKVSLDGNLGFYADMVTAIPEGDHQEFMGWLAPGFKDYSTSRAYMSWLSPKKSYKLDTNLHGEERAYVITGEYEKVFPFDIYPVQLVKAIMIGDVEDLENLGIYEVSEEDFALCEFVCTSKINVQEVVREGLDMVRKEFS